MVSFCGNIQSRWEPRDVELDLRVVQDNSNVNNFSNTNDTYKIVVPDSLYDTFIVATNWVAIADHIMKQSDWNAAHPDDILG